ncbi:MAG TPA: hypothetical protein DHV14_01770 [Micrococcales bacterium]|nr:hypothetical protein [Micrococcales bacterium]
MPTTSPRGATPPPPQEFRVLTLPREASRSEVRTLLTQEAEYGHWELARSVLYVGGVRKVWLRRRLHRVSSTL